MSTQVRNCQTGWMGLRELLSKHLPLETETSLYILVSALDVFMTCIVLSHQTADGTHFTSTGAQLASQAVDINWFLSPGL